MRGLAAVLCLLAAPAVLTKSEVAPAGWRDPTSGEASQAWRSDRAHRYLAVSADFDGDGRTDQAKLLVRSPAPGAALVVLLGRSPMRPIVLQQLVDVSLLDEAGIDIVKPGEYRTACGKGYWKCGEGEPDKLTLDRPAINFFNFEKASSFFFFDPPNRSFRMVPISD